MCVCVYVHYLALRPHLCAVFPRPLGFPGNDMVYICTQQNTSDKQYLIVAMTTALHAIRQLALPHLVLGETSLWWQHPVLAPHSDLQRTPP